MSLSQASIDGEDFIGLFGVASDKYAVVSPRFKDVSALGVPTVPSLVYGTQLIGIFCAGNSRGLLLPYFTSEHELNVLKKGFDPLGVEIGVLRDHHTSCGNLIACNDNTAIVSPLVKDISVVGDVLDVEVVCMDLAGHVEVGSCLTVTNKGFIAHPDCIDILPELTDILGVEGSIGTVNYGVPYVSTGLLANSNGAIVGGKTTGIEMGRVDEALGFL